jgi:hypothetical protein
MYKVIHSDDLPGYKQSCDWLIITPYIKEKSVHPAYKLKGTTRRDQWYSVVSNHPTKGSADKAYRKLTANNSDDNKPVNDEVENNKPYHLSMTELQAQVIINALELYSRIGMGQLQEIVYVLRMNSSPGAIDFDALDKVEKLAREASSYFMKGSGGYYGISSNKINDSFRVAWDIQQVIRYRLAWDRNPEGGIQVHFDEPYKTSAEELAIIKKAW